MKLIDHPVWLYKGELLAEGPQALLESIHDRKLPQAITPDEGKKGTMAYNILRNHSITKEGPLEIKFDSMISHDLTFVGIIQTARASGLKEFPLPYVLTNCHNSLCAVGGTINRDDHTFGNLMQGWIFTQRHSLKEQIRQIGDAVILATFTAYGTGV